MDKLNLIKQIKKGDKLAFNSLCMEEYPALKAYAAVFLPDDWAKDAVQDVLFHAWQHRESLDETQSAHYYLLRCVHNRCLDFIKKEALSQTHREWNERQIRLLIHSASDINTNPVIREMYNGDLRRSINQAISQLSPKCREVFCLSYLEEMSYKDIAGRLGISVKTVEAHMYNALKSLRKSLSGEMMAILLLLIHI